MSSQSLEKKEYIIIFYDNHSFREDFINFNNILIPFSKFGTSKSPLYIYNGEAKIPFNKRHPIFRKLLLDEYSE